MPQGYRNEAGEFVESKGIPNLTFEWLSPKPKPMVWHCAKCATASNTNSVATFSIQRMKLLPVNKDIPAEYWECTNLQCKHQITMKERDAAFEVVSKDIIDKYKLHKFAYNKQLDLWDIELSEFIGTDRLDSKRRKITIELRRELIDELLDGLENSLSIQVDNLKDFFREE